MNDTKVEDRFYKEEKEGIPAKKNQKLLEFAPEPMQVIEAKRKKMKFTVGAKYPLVEQIAINSRYRSYSQTYCFKTIDDAGNEVVVDEKYFIPSGCRLSYEDVNDNGSLFAEVTSCDFDLRKEAAEKGISDDTFVVEEFVPVFKAFERAHDLHEGIVKDDGNPLILDINQCMANVDKVFYGNKSVDPNGILESIRNWMPHRIVIWEDEVLTVDSAKTKIRYDDVQKVYEGLNGFISSKQAAKLTCKLIANKLKKLF